MSVEQNLLFAVLAFEDELIDLQQLTAACRAWSSDKSKPLADLLVERGWVSAEDRGFLEKKAERKLAKHQDDPRVTLNAMTRGDVCDALLKEVDDSEVRQSLSAWPSDAPVLIETIGQTLDESQQPKTRYTWVSEVGAGGLGKVWLARDNDLSREVALKEIKPGSGSREAVRRLIKEAQITGQLQHPGIVPVYEVSYSGRPFYTMKLVRGETLSKAVRNYHKQKQTGNEDRLVERRLLNVFLNICDALAYAHSRGVIHRDLKPENIVLGEYGEAIVLDWGLARQVNSDDEDTSPIVITEEGRTDATQAGQKLGTPGYMAPEQASGRVEHMDERTDIYGLGAILFEILTGQPPHRMQKDATPKPTSTHADGPPPPQSQSPIAEMLHRIATGETPRARSIDRTIPDELDTICATAMARHRGERYQTAKELKAALLEFQVHEESIELAARADDDLAAARQSGHYDDFSRARFGFETALDQWPENARAAERLKEARRDYAQAAFDRGDFDLALSQLETADPDQNILVASIKAAAAERNSRTVRIRRLQRFGLAASLMIAVLASVSAAWINSERNKALTAQQEEATQRGIAVQNEQEAQKERQAAVSSERKAVAARMIAERNAYNSDMLLAQRDWEAANIEHLHELLDRHRDRDDLKGFEWFYWDRVSHSDLLTLRGHTNSVDCATFSADGQRLASASQDGTVKVWDVATGQESFTLEGHSATVHSVAFSPNGKWLASAGQDKTVRVWDAATGRESLILKGHLSDVHDVAFSPDGKRLVSANGGPDLRSRLCELKVWDVATGQESLTVTAQCSTIEGVVFSPDGRRLAAACGKSLGHGTVRIWDASTGEELLTLVGGIMRVDSVAFSPDGLLVAASNLNTVKIWDAASGQEAHTLNGHASTVHSVVFSTDGQRLASASRDQTIKIWNTATGRETLTMKGHTGGVMSVAFNPDGQRLASASVDGTVKVWDSTAEQESLSMNGPGDLQGIDVAFSPDGKRLASSMKGATVWDTATGEETLTLNVHDSSVNGVAFSPDGKRLAIASNGATVWDAATGLKFLALNPHTDSVNCVAFSPDGLRLASASGDHTVKVWDATTGKESLTLKGHTGIVNSVVFSQDGQQLATASDDKTARTWNSTTGAESRTFKGHSDVVKSVAFEPGGKRLATASGDHTVKVWDAISGQESYTLKGHTRSVASVVFNPNGQRLASASADNTIKVWDAITGQELLTLKGHTSEANGVAFSPDGQQLASASDWSQSVKIWDAHRWTPDLRAQSQARGLLKIERNRVESLETLQMAIRSNKTISDMVQKQALDWAELFWKNGRSLQKMR